MFAEALLIIAKTWKQTKYPLTDEWINKMWYIYNRILHSHEKEWDNVIWNNMDGPRGYHTKWSKPERKINIIWYGLYVESKNNYTSEILYKTEIDPQT